MFRVSLPVFKGPFDLLLFFIERDELDIHDIPIAYLTNQFLDYLKQLESLNIEVASEFILVASTLMRIKAKMLLPRIETDEDGNQIDPRTDLVAQLIEYKLYKQAAEKLIEFETDRLARYERPQALTQFDQLAKLHTNEIELQAIDLYKLLKVYHKVLQRNIDKQNTQIHTIVPYPYTTEGQKDFINQQLSLKPKIAFDEIIALNPTKLFVVFCFLAILELIQSQTIIVTIGDGFNNFWLEPAQNNILN